VPSNAQSSAMDLNFDIFCLGISSRGQKKPSTWRKKGNDYHEQNYIIEALECLEMICSSFLFNENVSNLGTAEKQHLHE
jgi:hypothetical protein